MQIQAFFEFLPARHEKGIFQAKKNTLERVARLEYQNPIPKLSFSTGRGSI
jgi:hypothetical protein